MKRTVVWLTNSQVKALAAMSKKSLAPLSALVRQAVKDLPNALLRGPIFLPDFFPFFGRAFVIKLTFL